MFEYNVTDQKVKKISHLKTTTYLTDFLKTKVKPQYIYMTSLSQPLKCEYRTNTGTIKRMAKNLNQNSYAERDHLKM